MRKTGMRRSGKSKAAALTGFQRRRDEWKRFISPRVKGNRT
jgi:hypothetical protein